MHALTPCKDLPLSKCFVNGSLSDSQPLTCGIPQGTILWLLLFILYINDLPNCLNNSHPRMYADDTHLTFASNNVVRLEEYMNDDLTKITEWLTANKLTLNKSKTEFMLIGSRQRLNTFNRLPSFTIDGNSIKKSRIYEISWSIYRSKLVLECTYRTYFQKNCFLHWHLEEKQVFCSFWNTSLHL